jgi:hypothetical protein
MLVSANRNGAVDCSPDQGRGRGGLPAAGLRAAESKTMGEGSNRTRTGTPPCAAGYATRNPTRSAPAWGGNEPTFPISASDQPMAVSRPVRFCVQCR